MFCFRLISTRCTSRRAESQSARNVSCQLALLKIWSVLIVSAVQKKHIWSKLTTICEIYTEFFSGKKDSPDSISIAEVTGNCFPSITFSMQMSKGTQQANQPASETEQEAGLHDPISVSIPMRWRLLCWDSKTKVLLIFSDNLDKSWLADFKFKGGNFWASSVCNFCRRPSNFSGLTKWEADDMYHLVNDFPIL